MTTAVTQFKEYRLRNRLEAKVPRSEVTAMETFLHKTQYRELVELLIEKADELGEHPRTKKGQDLAFVGHSLGGALAQAGLHTFCVRTSRIPLPGYHIICSTSHAPATKNETNAQFMRMMEENDEMLSLNGIHFYISHQFEKGDFVPQSGGSHLGSVVYKSKPPLLPFASTIRHERLTCLSFHAHVFSPLATAQVKEIVSAPTHGRRIGSGTEQDYQLTELNSQEVHDFDHALKLRGKLAKVFQYSILSCPKVTEWVRKNLGGRVILPVYSLYNRLTGPGEGEREADDVLYMRFSSNRALCQLTTGMGRPRRAARTEQALAPAASM